MDVNAKIVVDGLSHLADILKPEEAEAISRAKIYQSGRKLLLTIEAESVSDLRAAVNSWLRLIKMCVEIEEVLEDG